MFSASLFLAQLKRVSAEKTQKVRTDLQGQLIIKIKESIKSAVYCLYQWDSFSGDSFVVNAFLRRGMEECERYSAADHKLKNAQVGIAFTFAIISSLYLTLLYAR